METIQIVIDSKLRQAADRVAKRTKVNRSALVREALREHLKRLHIKELEERERRAYLRQPETPEEKEEVYLWEREFAWPDE
jgi:metal-responsive CopG/Arc/MetJ family transcriptional regulator